MNYIPRLPMVLAIHPKAYPDSSSLLTFIRISLRKGIFGKIIFSTFGPTCEYIHQEVAIYV